MEKHSSNARHYIIGAAAGLGLYLLGPKIASSLLSTGNYQNDALLQKLENVIVQERMQTDNSLGHLENKLEMLGNELASMKKKELPLSVDFGSEIQEKVHGWGIEPQQQYPVRKNIDVAPVIYPIRQGTAQSQPNLDGNSHDFYLSWQSYEDGFPSKSKSYELSLSTGKVVQSIGSFFGWIKSLFSR